MKTTARQLRRIIKEEKTKIISEIIRRLPPHVEDPLFAALDQYVVAAVVVLAAQEACIAFGRLHEDEQRAVLRDDQRLCANLIVGD